MAIMIVRQLGFTRYHVNGMTPNRRRMAVLAMIALVVAIGAAIVMSQNGRRSPPPELPVIATSIDPEEMDPAIARLIEEGIAQVRNEPGNADARARLAMSFCANGMYEPALALFEQVISMESRTSQRAVWWFLAAYTQGERGEIDAALRSIDESISINPTHAPLHWQRGFWLLDMDRLDEAETAFVEAARLAPDDVAARVGMARVRLQRGEPESAAEILERLLADAGRGQDRTSLPNEMYIRQLLAIARRDLDDVDDAAGGASRNTGMTTAWPNPWLNDLASLQTGYRAKLQEARSWVDAGQPGTALSVLEPLLRERPDDVRALNYYASALAAMGRREAALAALEKALQIQPDLSLTYMTLSRIYERDDPAKCLSYAEMAVQYNALSGYMYKQLGRALALNDRTEESAAALTKAVRLGAHDWDTRLLLGRMLNQSGRPVEAERVLRIAAKSAPDSASIFAALARATAEQGRLDEARQWLDRAQQLNPNEVSIPYVAARLQQLQADQSISPRPPAHGPAPATSP